MLKYHFSLHVHFYQPPRLNPLTGHIGAERGAAPYRNWNERTVETIYRPNAELDNFSRFSFDIGSSSLDWLNSHHPQVGDIILETVACRHNMVAAPFCQTPLPLLSAKDRLVLLRWGMMETRRRFGMQPKGVFLPMFAVNLETLQSVVDAGYEFTILRSAQVANLPKRGGAGPYRISLPSGDEIKIFVIDDGLSATLRQEMVERGGSGYWARRKLVPHCREAGHLTLVYLDGDWIGQHQIGEPAFIYYLMTSEVLVASHQPITLTQYYDLYPTPLAEIRLVPTALDEFTKNHGGLMKALQAVLEEAETLMNDLKGDPLWTLDPSVIQQLSDPQDPLLVSYLYLQQALADCAGMEYYPQLNIERILLDVAYALNQLYQETGEDLTPVLTQHLDSHLLTLYHEAAAQFEDFAMTAA